LGLPFFEKDIFNFSTVFLDKKDHALDPDLLESSCCKSQFYRIKRICR
jgi:hypothetical protein